MTDDTLKRLAEESEALRAAGPGVDLALRAETPEDGLAQLEAVREEAQRRKRAVEAEVIRHKREIEAQMSTLKAELAERMREAELALAPLKDVMAQLEEGIWTVSLYLGEKEKIHTLRDGAPAPADAPVTIRQLVLAMDEECAIAAEEGGIDALSIEEFDEWILADPAHLDQVLPEEKGVVALVPRWQAGKNYDNPWMTAQVEKANKTTYFLMRNGDQLYRLWTEFNAGKTLLPTRDEFANLFWKKKHWHDEDGPEKQALKPGTEEWEKAAEAAEARERHYMRVSLIFEGILHRTTLWHPVQEGVSFLDPAAHREGKVRFIMDAEEDRLLGTDRQPWDEYIEERQGQLRAGMRVVIANNGLQAESYALRGGAYERSQNGRCNPRMYPTSIDDLPEEGALLEIEERESNGDLVVRFKRTKEVYDPDMWVPSKSRPGWGHRGGYRVPKQRASVRLRQGDWWVLPFDLCEEEELRAYLTARLDRKHYIRMFPIIKAALVAKAAERRLEEPFIEMLAGVLARENGGTVDEARERLPELIRWYKLSNRYHRPLLRPETAPEEKTEGGRVKSRQAADGSRIIGPVEDPNAERERERAQEEAAKAVRVIVAEDARRRKTKTADEQVVEDLRFIYEDAMLVARQRGSGKYVVLEPMEEDDNVYARKVVYGVRAGATEDVDWWKPEPHVVNRWEVLWESERWSSWDVGAVVADHLTGPEKEEGVRQILEWAADHDCSNCSGKGHTITWTYPNPKERAVKVKEPCEKCGETGRRSLEVYSITWDPPGRDERGAFMVWGPAEDRDYLAMGGHVLFTRKPDGLTYHVGSRGMSRNRIASWNNETGLPVLRTRALWINEERIEQIERAHREKLAADAEKRRRAEEVYPFTRHVERQRKNAGQARHLAEFVARFEHPELYEGHMKAHPDERYDHESLRGLHDAIREYLDLQQVVVPGVTTVQDVWLATIGEDAPVGEGGWLLAEPLPEDPGDEEPEELEGDWDFESVAEPDEDYLLGAGE